MKKLFAVLLISALVLTGCTSTTQNTNESIIAPTEPVISISNKKTNMKRPDMTIDQSKTYTANFVTNYGDFAIELDAANKPITVNNFVYLANSGFYDGLTFHRIIDGFMIQGGDPDGIGTGGPGYKFEDEVDGRNLNDKGTISMANSGPNTNGSQFFINLVDNNYLDPKHTAFGKVIEGMEVVEEIGSVEVDGSVPVEPVIIESVKIVVK